MTRLAIKHYLCPALLVILGGLKQAYAGSGHQSSAPKADCGTLKTLLDNGVAPQDIAKDALVMQAMMRKCESSLSPSVSQATGNGHHSGESKKGPFSEPTIHNIGNPPAQAMPATNEKITTKNSHDSSHAHQH
ncbi:hypothetical protein [Zhongshania sp.]|uniref:hypothetical protein n=1 Tax=Zhongshania sp. TaxID=1971902 RepID=UPI003566740F